MNEPGEPAQQSEPSVPRSAGGRFGVLALIIIALAAVAVLLLDQLVKHLVTGSMALGEVRPLLGAVLELHYVENSGAAFSLGENFTWVLSLVAVGVVVFIIWYARRIRSLWWGLVFGLLLGGALGNLGDRLFRGTQLGNGRVVDFLQLWGFPAIFNIADSAIVVAMAVFILLTLRGIRLDGARVHRHRDDGGGPAASSVSPATPDPTDAA